ncbi:hypothetical protein B0H11DRAFT_1918002 [Mycena galericulata]|nr:hypothetical protein B0H11DRAFT_1918002 [Mycena galericulata]
MSLGYPSIDLETKVWTGRWDDSVYAGLRKFHEGKGFDAGSHEVALHLGHHLYQLCPEMEVSFAHLDEISHAETKSEASAAAEWLDEHDSKQSFLLDIVESAPQSWTWKAVMFVKLGLILALSFGSLYEYGWVALSQ